VDAHALFAGPGSLRDPSERLAFWLTALFAFPAALLIGYVLHESIGASQVALFIVIAMIYVTLARGRLLGSSIRVHETQYPRVFSIVKSTCAALDIPMPMVFVREDNFVPIAALGFGEPYSLVLSTRWIEVFRDDELAFMIGRELGHIAAGHTRFLSLLSVNGNENPFISMIFGAWLRRCTMTCDKIGLLCCGSLDAAIRAIGVASFHEFGRRVDYEAFAEQHSEIANDTIARWGTWMGSEPYATTRITSLRHFITSEPYVRAERWFERERDEEPPHLAAQGHEQVVARDCAGWWRRMAAFVIDTVIVVAIIGSFGGHVVEISDRAHRSVRPSDVQINVSDDNGNKSGGPSIHISTPPPATSAPSSTTQSTTTAMKWGPFMLSPEGVFVNLHGTPVPLTAESLIDALPHLGVSFWLPVYLAALVIVSGQSFGMLITGLRVVTTDFQRPGVLRTIGRYAIVLVAWWLIVALSFFWRRILLHDRLTGTRVVKVERVTVRSALFARVT
jgi:hypothetical protein